MDGELLSTDPPHDFPVNNGSALNIVAARSGQRVNIIAFLNGNDVDIQGTDPPPADFVPPVLLSSSPSSGASGIELDLRSPDALYSGLITITFDESLSLESGNFTSGNLSVRASGALNGLSGTIGLLSGIPGTLAFAPLSGLSGSTLYQIVVGNGIMDEGGNELGQDYIIPFVSYTTPGRANIVSTWPASGASGIALDFNSSGGSGGKIWALFDRDLALGSGNANSGNISLRLFNGTSGWSGAQAIGADNRTLVFGPTSVLSGNASYEMLLGSGIMEKRYNIPLGSTITVPFISDANPTGPVFVSSFPASGASGLAFDLFSSGGSGYASVTFNKALFSGSSNINSGNISLRISGSSGWSGAQFLQPGDNKTIVFDPASSLSGSKIYQLVIGSGLKEAIAGIPLGQTITIPFVTDANPPPPDTTPPFVSSFAPAFNALGVAVNTTCAFVYNEKIDSGSVTTNNVGLWQSGTKVSGSLNIAADNKTITFVPNQNLSGSTVYNIRASGVKDTVLNQQTAASGFSGAFTTVFVDTTPPFVSTINPDRGASNIAVNTAPTVTYNEALLAASVSTSTVQLYQGSSPVVGAVTLSADNLTATFTPSSNLSGNTIYNLRASGVQDTAGNKQTTASGYSGAFTTATLDVTPPFVSSGTPARGFSGVALNATPNVVYNENLLAVSVSTSTVQLYLAGSPVAGSVALGADSKTCTFTPSANLTAQAVYNLRASGVKDAAGNTQTAASGYSGAFTTTNTSINSTPFYNASDNGSTRLLGSITASMSSRAGWRFTASSSYLGKIIARAQVTLQRNGPGSTTGGLVLHQLNASTGAEKMRLFLNGDGAPAFNSFSTSKSNYVWDCSGTPTVTIAATDIFVLDASGVTGTGSSDNMTVYRNSSDVQDTTRTHWVSTDWGDPNVVTTDQSGFDMCGILYEPA